MRQNVLFMNLPTSIAEVNVAELMVVVFTVVMGMVAGYIWGVMAAVITYVTLFFALVAYFSGREDGIDINRRKGLCSVRKYFLNLLWIAPFLYTLYYLSQHNETMHISTSDMPEVVAMLAVIIGMAGEIGILLLIIWLYQLDKIALIKKAFGK